LDHDLATETRQAASLPIILALHLRSFPFLQFDF
jgi:hypothetical protein